MPRREKPSFTSTNPHLKHHAIVRRRPRRVLARAARPVLEALERRCLLSGEYGALPMSFEQNVGQTDPQVDFLSRGSGYALFLTGEEAVMSLAGPDQGAGWVLRMQFIGANPVQGAASGLLAGKSNYFVGEDPAGWLTNVSNFGSVRYSSLYEGIDLLFKGNQQALQYDFIVAPGASAASIALNFEGAQSVSIDAQGRLVLTTGVGELLHDAPFIYQDIDGQRQQVSGGFVIHENGQVGFTVGQYDAAYELVIDPTLAYSTFLGGSGQEEAHAVATDAGGNAYLTGFTMSSGFPTVSGGFDTNLNNNGDVFITKLNAAGTALVYSTFVGGNQSEEGHGIAVDASGNAYVTGYTQSSAASANNRFPTTDGTGGTVAGFDQSHNGGRDAFLLKLNATGSALIYSTFLGGSGDEEGRAVALDAANNAYVTGYTASSGLASPGANDTTLTGGRDAFVARINPAVGGAASRVYLTYLGGSSSNEDAFGIDVDAAGNAHVTGYTESNNFPTTLGAFDTTHNGGRDAFVTKFDPTGATQLYSTYIGGSALDEGRAIALDAAGNAYVTGTTESTSGIATSGAFDTSHNGGRDIFLNKLSPTGATRLYGSYLGGSSADEAHGVAVDAAGEAHVTGFTESTNFNTFDALDASHNGGRDVVVAKFNASASALLFSTYLGGSGNEEGRGITLDAVGGVYVSGYTQSSGFPTVGGSFDTSYNTNGDAFALKITALQVGNQPPTANNQTVGTNEDTDVTITLTGDDGDPALTQTLTFKITSDPTNGALYQRAPDGSRGAQITGATLASPVTVTDSLGRVIFAPDANEFGAPYASFQFTVTDNGTPPLTDATPATVTVNVAAVNDAPSITSDDASVMVNEGQTASNTGTWADIDGDNVTLAASVGTIIKNLDGTWSWSFNSTDGPDETQTVTVTVNDGTTSTNATFALTVNNVAPSVAADNAAVTVDEGDTAGNTGTYFDPGDDTLTLTASVGIVTDNGDGTWSWSLGTSDGPDESQTVTITATDSDGDFTTTTFSLTVNNVAPTLTISGTATTDEGSTYTLNLSSSDPGSDTITSWTINWGDGNIEVISGNPSSVTHVYEDGPASYTISATATDEDGTYASNTHGVSVQNLAPIATDDSYGASESGTVSGNVITDDTGGGSDSDPAGANDPLAVTAYTQPQRGSVVVNPDGTFTFDTAGQFEHLAAGETQTVSFTYTISDGDGGSDTATVTVTVTGENDAPVITSISNSSPDCGCSSFTRAGSPITLSATFSDLDSSDMHTAVIDWGDGTSSAGVVSQNPASPPNPSGGSVFGSHVYSQGGIYTITLTVGDGNGGTHTMTTTTAITGVGLAANGTLYIIGTNAKDQVQVSRDGNRIKVVADFLGSNKERYFQMSAVKKIYALLCGGDDQMQVAGELTIPSYIDAGAGKDQIQTGAGDDTILGGDGDDQIQAGSGNNLVDGGAGNDQIQVTGGHNILLGGDGNDVIQGSTGRDLMIGGWGSDKLIGNDQDDILIAGYTDHDSNFDALKTIHAEWRTGSSFTTRVSNLRNGGGLNGSYLFNDSTVHDDRATDELTGNNGSDWFLFNEDGDAGKKDKVTDANSIERLNWVDIDFVW